MVLESQLILQNFLKLKGLHDQNSYPATDKMIKAIPDLCFNFENQIISLFYA